MSCEKIHSSLFGQNCDVLRKASAGYRPVCAEPTVAQDGIFQVFHRGIREIRKQRLPVRVAAKLFQWSLYLPGAALYAASIRTVQKFATLVQGTFAFPGIIDKKMTLYENIHLMPEDPLKMDNSVHVVSRLAVLLQPGIAMIRSYCKAILNLQKTEMVGIGKSSLQFSAPLFKVTIGLYLCNQAIKLGCGYAKVIKMETTASGLHSRQRRELLRNLALSVTKVALSTFSAICVLYSLGFSPTFLLLCSSTSVGISVYKRVQHGAAKNSVRKQSLPYNIGLSGPPATALLQAKVELK